MTRMLIATLFAISATSATAGWSPIPIPTLTFPPEETQPVTKGCTNITSSQITCE